VLEGRAPRWEEDSQVGGLRIAGEGECSAPAPVPNEGDLEQSSDRVVHQAFCMFFGAYLLHNFAFEVFDVRRAQAYSAFLMKAPFLPSQISSLQMRTSPTFTPSRAAISSGTVVLTEGDLELALLTFDVTTISWTMLFMRLPKR
jgi:hypothetical protein